MKLITISREYDAGGRAVAAQLSCALGWELLDHELLHRAAQLEHLPDAELEALDEQAISLADPFRLHPPHQRYIHGLSEAARQAAAQGNVILVGRGSRQLVGETPEAFHLRLVAPRDWRARRQDQFAVGRSRHITEEGRSPWRPGPSWSRCRSAGRSV